MVSKPERYLWPVVFGVVVALAIPWFLWGTDDVVAGLPVWVWWHVGWLVLTSLVFWTFTRRAWGLGVRSKGVGDVDEVGQ